MRAAKEKQIDDCMWWTRDWTDEQKRIAGDPNNTIKHRRRLVKSVDRFQKRVDIQLAREYFNPVAAK
jgi:hypothetical protein